MTQIEIVQRFYDAFGSGDLDAATAMFADGVRMTDPGLGSVKGLPALRDYLDGLKGPLPDARAIVERAFEAGDTVIVEGRFTGTNTGPLPGPEGDLPASGREVDLPFADFSRLREGEIVEYRTYYDQVGLFTQLGLMEEE
ncbi:MAG TPA: nuclear transport factor 2 family protein [Solirubrobacterales bacterium]|nr:nuclear transport factor 2 family protein [Solirubrobacterales bacterium]